MNLGFDIPGLEQHPALGAARASFLLFGGENQAFDAGRRRLQRALRDRGHLPDGEGLPGVPRPRRPSTWRRAARACRTGSWCRRSRRQLLRTRTATLYQPAQDGHRSLDAASVRLRGGDRRLHREPAGDRSRRGQTYSFTTYFIIGRGDVASVVDVMQEIRGTPTGSFGGRVVDALTQAPVAARRGDRPGRATAATSTRSDTDANGAFRANLPAGELRVPRRHDDAHDGGDGRASASPSGRRRASSRRSRRRRTSRSRSSTSWGVPSPARSSWSATSVARSSVRTRGPSSTTSTSARRCARRRSTAPHRIHRECVGIRRMACSRRTSARGATMLAVSRGVEYDLHSEPVVLVPGAFVSTHVALRRAVDTSGYVAADLHLHSVNSVDSDLALVDRVKSIAGEGLEFAAATDHNFITDYAPTIAALGLQDWLTATVGMELTTFEMGHFNGYPLRIDPGNIRGGDFRWDGQPPDSLFEQLRGARRGPGAHDRRGQPPARRRPRLLHAVQHRRRDRRHRAALGPARGLRALQARVRADGVLLRLRHARGGERQAARPHAQLPGERRGGARR